MRILEYQKRAPWLRRRRRVLLTAVAGFTCVLVAWVMTRQLPEIWMRLQVRRLAGRAARMHAATTSPVLVVDTGGHPTAEGGLPGEEGGWVLETRRFGRDTVSLRTHPVIKEVQDRVGGCTGDAAATFWGSLERREGKDTLILLQLVYLGSNEGFAYRRDEYTFDPEVGRVSVKHALPCIIVITFRHSAAFTVSESPRGEGWVRLSAVVDGTGTWFEVNTREWGFPEGPAVEVPESE